ncbi:MAG: hypothetical protein JSW01_04975 [Candidatus Bathyarchaeota archaeon]|nr:MAG: hypothetical protein JSW01_04975 [Candidatus Bathyarchaeota archaeon]
MSIPPKDLKRTLFWFILLLSVLSLGTLCITTLYTIWEGYTIGIISDALLPIRTMAIIGAALIFVIDVFGLMEAFNLSENKTIRLVFIFIFLVIIGIDYLGLMGAISIPQIEAATPGLQSNHAILLGSMLSIVGIALSILLIWAYYQHPKYIERILPRLS